MADSGGETDKNIEIWKIKKLIKALESARGNGTSMISLIMPPRLVLLAGWVFGRERRSLVVVIFRRFRACFHHVGEW